MDADSKPAIGDKASAAPPVYVVLERDVIVAEDLAASLEETGPCEVLRVHNPDALKAALTGLRRVTVAYVDISYEALLEHGVDRALERCGARVVFTRAESCEEEIAARGWRQLRRPFNARMIRASLAKAPVAEGPHRGAAGRDGGAGKAMPAAACAGAQLPTVQADRGQKSDS